MHIPDADRTSISSSEQQAVVLLPVQYETATTLHLDAITECPPRCNQLYGVFALSYIVSVDTNDAIT